MTAPLPDSPPKRRTQSAEAERPAPGEIGGRYSSWQPISSVVDQHPSIGSVAASAVPAPGEAHQRRAHGHVIRVLAAGHDEVAEAARDGGEDDVVHGAAEGGAARADVGEAGTGERPPAMGAGPSNTAHDAMCM